MKVHSESSDTSTFYPHGLVAALPLVIRLSRSTFMFVLHLDSLRHSFFAGVVFVST